MDCKIDEDIPEDLKELAQQILGALADLTGRLANTANSHGDGRMGRRFPSDEEIANSLGLSGGARRINVIPSDKYGSCSETLVVIIGPKTDFKERMHDAHHHVNVNCKGFTKNVIFISFIWNEVIWSQFVSGSRRGAFKDTKCIMILPFQRRALSLKT